MASEVYLSIWGCFDQQVSVSSRARTHTHVRVPCREGAARVCARRVCVLVVGGGEQAFSAC